MDWFELASKFDSNSVPSYHLKPRYRNSRKQDRFSKKFQTYSMEIFQFKSSAAIILKEMHIINRWKLLKSQINGHPSKKSQNWALRGQERVKHTLIIINKSLISLSAPRIHPRTPKLIDDWCQMYVREQIGISSSILTI